MICSHDAVECGEPSPKVGRRPRSAIICFAFRAELLDDMKRAIAAPVQRLSALQDLPFFHQGSLTSGSVATAPKGLSFASCRSSLTLPASLQSLAECSEFR